MGKVQKQLNVQEHDRPDAGPEQDLAKAAADLQPIPLAAYDGKASLAMHVDLYLQDQHRIPLRRLRMGLETAGAELANGRRIETNADSLRWLLERLERIRVVR